MQFFVILYTTKLQLELVDRLFELWNDQFGNYTKNFRELDDLFGILRELIVTLMLKKFSLV